MVKGKTGPVYSEELVAAAVKLAAAGGTNTEVMESLCVSRATFYRWIKKNPDFGAALATARLPSNIPEDIEWLEKCKRETKDWFLSGLVNRGIIKQDGDGLGSYTRENALPPSWVVDRLRILESRVEEQKFEVVIKRAVPEDEEDEEDEESGEDE